MFPALSHQLHTSLLCIMQAALREGGVAMWLNVCVHICGRCYVLNVIYRVSELMSCL